MILPAASSKSERAAYALMFRQLAQTARAIHDIHKATDDLRRVRGLAAAVIKVVEASAPTQTIKAQPSLWKHCGNSTREPAKKPSGRGSSPNGHGAVGDCIRDAGVHGGLSRTLISMRSASWIFMTCSPCWDG